ncbi:hypothetical protein PR048_008518 [Dryococelus australis]|uniref:Uncharacterized protein n=1 Tax=Dryococelus australis TaxID=614101 RepID=A0ABQ9HXC1_9NEOP|nr:hypothetical protein PR048_008518 [Dryococelus australis]
MAAALSEVKGGRMSCLGAHIPEATLCCCLNTNDDEMPIHGGRFREVFSERQLEDLNNYLTAMEKMFFGMTKLQSKRLVFNFPERCEILHPFSKETRMAQAASIARAMGFNKPNASAIYNADESGLSMCLIGYQSQACDNFMVTHPGQAITDRKASELLSIAYFKAATVDNAVNGFKECEIESYDPLVFNEHDFASAKTTDHVLVMDNAESENATAQTAAPGGQHTETPDEHEAEQNQEPGPSGNCVSVKSKPCRSIFDFKPLPKERPCVKIRKSHSQCTGVITSTPMKEMLVEKEAQVEQERLKQQRQEAWDAKRGIVTKKLKLDSC